MEVSAPENARGAKQLDFIGAADCSRRVWEPFKARAARYQEGPAGDEVAGLTIALFLWVHRALGENWSTSVEPKEQHALVTSGPYRWVRHPMYTTMFVWTLAFFLVSANWFVGITWLALSILAASRAGEEEAALIEKFGTEYRAYMQRTARFLPGLRR